MLENDVFRVYNIDMDLKTFFEENQKLAVAFSGGVDSALLLYAAAGAGIDVRAYYVRSQFQPDFELSDARETAAYIGADLTVIEADVLSDEIIRANPADRCYYCKQRIMRCITEQAAADGYDLIVDGTNASDDTGDRPGYRALAELGIRSPLKECGITKAEIRQMAREAGLAVWDKPAYACLATRIPHGEEITQEKLSKTENAERILRDMGFADLRVRMRGDGALIQVRADQYERAYANLSEITDALAPMYSEVILDDKIKR